MRRQAFWTQAYYTLPSAQMTRLRRMHQGFQAEAIDDDTLVVMGASGSRYTIMRGGDGLTCSCPDFSNHQGYGLLCKHLCWLIACKGDGGVADLKGDTSAAVHKAWQVLSAELRPCVAELRPCASEDTEADPSAECAICYEDMLDLPMRIHCSSCLNKFHRVCLLRWLTYHSNCPLCRRPWS